MHIADLDGFRRLLGRRGTAAGTVRSAAANACNVDVRMKGLPIAWLLVFTATY